MSSQKNPTKFIIKKPCGRTAPNKIKAKSTSFKDFIFTPTKITNYDNTERLKYTICKNHKIENEHDTDKNKAMEFRDYIIETVELYIREDTNPKLKKKYADILNSLIILRDRLHTINELYDTNDVFTE